MNGPKILVVEDEFLIRLTLSEALADEGYTVMEATNGEEALRILSADVALLITDMQLPGKINGAEIARRAREILPELPVIFMTGRPERIGSTTSSRDTFITKPYLPTEVCIAVRRMLSR